MSEIAEWSNVEVTIVWGVDEYKCDHRLMVEGGVCCMVFIFAGV